MKVQFTWPTSIDPEMAQGIVTLYNDAIGSTTVLGYSEQLSEDDGKNLVLTLSDSIAKNAIRLFAINSGVDLIGMAILSPSKMPNCRHIVNLSKGIIRSDYRKTGLLRQALLNIVRYCELQGYELITLDVRENSRPHRIWRSIGFTQYGRMEDYARVKGVSYAGVFLCQPTSGLKTSLASGKMAAKLMPKSEFKERLRSELESRITMTHPLIAKIVQDKAQWDLLRYMTLQGYQLTKHFLEYIEILYHHCPRGVHKRRLLMNMFEEETGRFSRTDNHVKLMQNFIRAIGIDEEARDAAQPLPNTKALIDFRMNLVRDPARFHMGAAAVMIASEGQNLETKAGEARHELLPRVYGLKQQDMLFFSVHQKEDVGHVKEGISLVADICVTPLMQQEALEAIRRTCDLFYGMYDGVAEAFAD